MGNKEYIQIMIESLEKKLSILQKIDALNKEQMSILKQDEVVLEDWERNTAQKTDCIEQINELDEGFQNLYDHLREELHGNLQEYAEEIRKMQELISVVTDLGVTIRVQEKRNKELAQKAFSQLKGRVKSMRQTSQVAKLYDTNMKKLNYFDAQFWDHKQ